ncbi:response regulator transcription factor [Shimazuella kribbensis]|uniref:response regulator transcription factor n=1 Tax=Shimazuella kribbensis TaxID=139808 RepID=UPI0004274C25|nr:response regulator transcription factor [Shimazuella kribbensis]
MNEKILLIEDDQEIAEMVVNYLTKEGMDVSHVADGLTASNCLRKEAFELILLDLMLPGMDGIELLKQIRTDSFVPVLILSAKDSELDKALGLGFGADDYIAKPFSLLELSARIKAMLRRVTQYTMKSDKSEAKSHITFHDLVLDMKTLRLYKKGKEIKLTAKELQILKLFMSEPKRAFSKEHIYRMVWKEDFFADENAIQVHISRLREKIEDDPSSPQYIKTVWGIGYRLGDFS